VIKISNITLEPSCSAGLYVTNLYGTYDRLILLY